MQKYHHWLQGLARSRLKQFKGKWIPARDTQNLPRTHEQYKAKIPAVKYREIYIGFTALTFCKWEKVPQKNQAETPYSEEGRELNFKRTKKKRMLARLDEAYSDNATAAAIYRKQSTLNNFEFIPKMRKRPRVGNIFPAMSATPGQRMKNFFCQSGSMNK